MLAADTDSWYPSYWSFSTKHHTQHSWTYSDQTRAFTHILAWVLTCDLCILSIILSLMHCLPWPLFPVWFLSQWGQLSQILDPNSSSVRWMTLQPLWTWVCVPACVSLCSETFVRAPQCFAVSLCIYTRACCVMRPSPVFCHLRNYTAGQCEPSVVSTADSVYPTKQQLVRQESMWLPSANMITTLCSFFKHSNKLNPFITVEVISGAISVRIKALTSSTEHSLHSVQFVSTVCDGFAKLVKWLTKWLMFSSSPIF